MKRSYLFVILLLSLSLLLASGTSGVEQNAPPVVENQPAEKPKVKPVFRTISAVEAASIIEQNKDILILDVRTPQERKQVRISGSKLVPVGDVIRGKFETDADQPIILVCAVGGRSYFAGKVMISRGYQEVYNLDGGIEAWRRVGLPVELGPELLEK